MNPPISLVTGGAGFIGSHVVEALLEAGHYVIVADSLATGSLANVPPRALFIQADLTNAPVVDRLFETFPIDYVFHLAGYTPGALSPLVRRATYTQNLLVSVNLVNAAVNVGRIKCFVQASSAAVYGRQAAPLREHLLPLPRDPYAVSKFAAELDLQQAHSLFDLNYITFRLHHVYGERMDLSARSASVVGQFVHQALHDEPLSIFGDGLQMHAFTHVSDVASVMARAVNVPEAYNHVFNLGSSHQTSMLELARSVSKAAGRRPFFVHLEQRLEMFHAVPLHDHAESVFGPLPSLPLAEGLARTVAWARAHPSKAASEPPLVPLEITRSSDRLWWIGPQSAPRPSSQASPLPSSVAV